MRRNSLGLGELVFQGITHIAPAVNIVFTFPIIAREAGADMPISLLLTTIVCYFIGNTVAEFSKYMPSSGGYYSFATRGLGSRTGYVATWCYLIYDVVGTAGATGFLGYLLADMLQSAWHVEIPWWTIALAGFAVIWSLTHYGIRVSMRTTALFGGLEILIMLALAITFLVHPGHGSSFTAPLKPANSPHHFGGILAGMLFSILALSGFEAPAPLAQESRRPGKLIGLAVNFSLISIGIFYVFTSYASAIGWGTGDMAAFASSANPYYAMGRALWGGFWWLAVLAVINSAIGTGIASTNAVSRVMYTMGRAGTLPAPFGAIHPVHQTPAFAIAFIQLAGIVMVGLVGFLLRPDDIFGFLGTVETLAVIILYVMANVALTFYVWREHRKDFSIWQHAVNPWFGALALLPVLFVTIYPVPAWPLNLTPYLVVGAIALGIGYMQWIEARHPGTLARGATVLVGRRTDTAGDVDWDAPAAPPH